MRFPALFLPLHFLLFSSPHVSCPFLPSHFLPFFHISLSPLTFPALFSPHIPAFFPSPFPPFSPLTFWTIFSPHIPTFSPDISHHFSPHLPHHFETRPYAPGSQPRADRSPAVLQSPKSIPGEPRGAGPAPIAAPRVPLRTQAQPYRIKEPPEPLHGLQSHAAGLFLLQLPQNIAEGVQSHH